MAKKPLVKAVKKEVKRLKVKAVRMGYYEHKRRRPGAVFFMNETDFVKHNRKGEPMKDKHGEQLFCEWVELAPGAKLPASEVPREKTLQEKVIEREEAEAQMLEDEAQAEAEGSDEEAEGDNVI